MSADVLRRAAALMRSRAENAAPGPWENGPHYSRPDCESVFAGRRSDAHYLAMYVKPENAAYIAAMSPLVALALADWLDGIAIEIGGAFDRERYADVNPNARHALTIARAYLNEPDTP